VYIEIKIVKNQYTCKITAGNYYQNEVAKLRPELKTIGTAD